MIAYKDKDNDTIVGFRIKKLSLQPGDRLLARSVEDQRVVSENRGALLINPRCRFLDRQLLVVVLVEKHVLAVSLRSDARSHAKLTPQKPQHHFMALVFMVQPQCDLRQRGLIVRPAQSCW
jgi:hypothetical protein